MYISIIIPYFTEKVNRFLQDGFTEIAKNEAEVDIQVQIMRKSGRKDRFSRAL